MPLCLPPLGMLQCSVSAEGHAWPTACPMSQCLGVEGGEEGEGMCAALRRLRSEGTLAHVGLGMNCNREAHQGVPHEVIRLLREVRS